MPNSGNFGQINFFQNAFARFDGERQGSGKKIRGREDLANIEVAGRGHRREIHVTMGLPLFLKKLINAGSE